jgi:hypothetical protein
MITKIFGEVVDPTQKICIADHKKIEIFTREQNKIALTLM